MPMIVVIGRYKIKYLQGVSRLADVEHTIQFNMPNCCLFLIMFRNGGVSTFGSDMSTSNKLLK